MNTRMFIMALMLLGKSQETIQISSIVNLLIKLWCTRAMAHYVTIKKICCFEECV